jgi:ribonuclease R
MAKRPPSKPQLPTEAEVLEFIQSSPSIVGKREISRHFGVTGGDKISLKALLKRMEEDGLLAKRQRKLIDRSSLPPVTVLEIIGTDKDGEAYAEPVEWDERQAGKPPAWSSRVRKRPRARVTGCWRRSKPRATGVTSSAAG